MSWRLMGLLYLGFKYYPETLSYVGYIGGKALEIGGVAARAFLQMAIQYVENSQRLRLQKPLSASRLEFEWIEEKPLELTEEQLAKILDSNERIPDNFILIKE